MKTIGFVDFYISEWHAVHYPQWIREACARTGKEFAVKYAWAEQDVSPVDGRTTAQWCEEYGVEQCASIEELCEKSDYIIVLAPSDPDKHLGYAEKVLPFGKNTYIDKTFAPDFTTAKKIYETAERYGTKFFSSSALRYATELSEVKNPVTVHTKGGGGNIAEYIIHQTEMVVETMNAPAESVRVELLGENHYLCNVSFQDGRVAAMEFYPHFGFEIAWKNEAGESKSTAITSDTFAGLMDDILLFFESGKLPFAPEQTLEVMKLREAVLKGVEKLGEQIKVSQ